MDQHTPQVIFQVLMARMPEFVAAVSQEITMALQQSRLAKIGYQQALQQASIIFVQSLCRADLSADAVGQPIIFDLPEDETDNIPIQTFVFSKRHFATNVHHYAIDVERFYVETYKSMNVSRANVSVSPTGIVINLLV